MYMFDGVLLYMQGVAMYNHINGFLSKISYCQRPIRVCMEVIEGHADVSIHAQFRENNETFCPLRYKPCVFTSCL